MNLWKFLKFKCETTLKLGHSPMIKLGKNMFKSFNFLTTTNTGINCVNIPFIHLYLTFYSYLALSGRSGATAPEPFRNGY